MKTICHYKRTPIALAPDEIVKCLNKYSNKYDSILYFDSITDYCPDISFLCDKNVPLQKGNVNDLGNKSYSLIHCHNRIAKTNKPTIIQYHSPPGTPMDLQVTCEKLVIAQYHATLIQFYGCKKIRNIIDIYDKTYNQNIYDKKIKIGFSPSTKYSKGNKSHESKGYVETEEILQKLKKLYNIEYDIIYNVPFKECLQRKSECNIIIDECVTNSYHRSGLEGLALGKMTICSLDKSVINVLKETSNCDIIPFENIWIYNLEKYLTNIIKNKGLKYILDKGKLSRAWMEKFWNPIKIINDFENIYDKYL